MKNLNALAISIPVTGVVATYLALGPLSCYYLIWAVFVFWGGFFCVRGRCGGFQKHHCMWYSGLRHCLGLGPDHIECSTCRHIGTADLGCYRCQHRRCRRRGRRQYPNVCSNFQHRVWYCQLLGVYPANARCNERRGLNVCKPAKLDCRDVAISGCRRNLWANFWQMGLFNDQRSLNL